MTGGRAPLAIRLGTLDGRDFEGPLYDVLVIGRADPDSAAAPDIDLGAGGCDAGSVSRRHARLIRDGDEVLIEDLGSLNGTYVQDVGLPPGYRHSLRPGDRVQFGNIIATIAW